MRKAAVLRLEALLQAAWMQFYKLCHHGQVALTGWQQGIDRAFHLAGQAEGRQALPAGTPLQRQVVAPALIDHNGLV
ncbi:hypothetical protein D3C85_1120890 [compost metagenome]